MTTALLLVDLQNDFLPGGRLAVPDADEVLPVAHKLMAVFPLVFATQDYHPADHLSFADNHPGRAAGERIDLDGLDQRVWPTHCVQGTEGAQLAQSLDQSRISRIIPKGTNPRVDGFRNFP